MTDLTPEEKLLRLIRAGEKEGKAKAVNAKPSQFSFNFDTLSTFFQKTQWFHPQNMLFLAFFLSALFLAYTFLFSYTGTKESTESTKSTAAEEKTVVKETLKEPVAKEAFLTQVSKRNVFESQGGAVEQGSSSTSSKQTTSEAFKDLNLIAVIDEKNPQAVIENKKVQKIFYVRQGDSIDTFQIEKVANGRVTLSYRGEKYDLTL